MNDERLTSVDSSLTISPAFCNPRNAIKRPIPAGIAFLTASGMAEKSLARIPVIVRKQYHLIKQVQVRSHS